MTPLEGNKPPLKDYFVYVPPRAVAVIHQWWELEEKFWDCLATGSYSGSKNISRTTALVGLSSKPKMTEARLCRS